MGYRILLRTDSKLKNMYEVYGTTTTAGSSVTFTEFSTEDTDELKAKIEELAADIGYENIRVVADVTYSVSVKLS